MSTASALEPNSDDYSHVDLSRATELVQLLASRLEGMHGRHIPDRQAGRARSAELAELSKELLFLSHLSRSIDLEIMSEYFVAKGETSHLQGE